ncbi:hypothetical protein ES319_D06G219500v1 [Gossypium barbadense]|uniref:Uncharacterized protein n=1 Tax=Gossypium barbadense TaxID=3634 RepID=A0A5J5R4R9_GOSBA|nr:hypothetical protein ES319_D06G219500v1 [Gossypium barbadense]
MAHKLKDAREKLDAIAEKRSKFHLREGVAEAETGRNRDRITNSIVNESEVIGRGDEKAEIVSMLRKNVNHHDDLSVYAICGIGVFDLRAWVCVSDDFDIASLTKAIVESIEQGNACNIQQLDPLQRAFGMGMDEGNVNLERIGRQIVQRCGGVPLAIKATRSILRFKSQESEWLSYKHLLPYMRQCFLFCSIFPKDYVMEKDKLIGLWMANGFIPSRGHMDLHDTGCEIFSELTWRSFLQDVKEHVHGIVTCKMHDLVHDLVTSMMDECYFFEEHSRRIGIATVAFFDPWEQVHLSCLNHLRYLCLHDGNMKTLPESTSSLQNWQTLNLRSCDNLQILRYLDLRECYKLSSMPIGLRQLSSLRKLNKFIMGKDNDSGLGNVKSATEAKNSNLINKQNLRSLSLSWRSDNNKISQHGNDEEILNALQPHSSLKKLYIYGYQGKLRFLKVLTIFGMGDLKYIKSSFNGDMESSFSSLEVLKILWAPCLEEWTVENGCPMLVKLLMLQSLKELDIRGSSVTLLKSLMMNATVLISLHIWEFYELRDLSDLLDNLLALEHLNLKRLQNFSSLETLELSHCNSLVSLPVNGLQELSSLSTLRIEKCKKLASMSKGVRYLTSLQNLHIRKCPKLTSLLECIQHLSSLRFLNIKECEGLVSLPNEIQHLTLLSRLEILNCPNLMSLPQGVRNLLALETLWIEECSHLERRYMTCFEL